MPSALSFPQVSNKLVQDPHNTDTSGLSNLTFQAGYVLLGMGDGQEKDDEQEVCRSSYGRGAQVLRRDD